MRLRLMVVVAIVLMAGALGVKLRAVVNMSTIVNSKHDFRPTSTAPIRASSVSASSSTNGPCEYCHTPHHAPSGAYLLNTAPTNQQFSTYSSTTMQATVTQIQPQDASKLCLTCHDGTVALSDVITPGGFGAVQGSSPALAPTSSSNLASMHGYSDDHPFGFVPVQGAEIQNPPPGDKVHLDGSGKVQCTSCHEPHQEFIDSTQGNFLVKSNSDSAICLTCHQKQGWNLSAHRLPPDPVEDLKYTSAEGAHTGYIGVSRNGCESCHQPHSPQTGERLLKRPEENTCFQCHDGTVVRLNLKNELVSKAYRHPVMVTPSMHDDSESPMSARFPMPERAASTPRHAECADCHNPHYAQATPHGSIAQPPAVTPPLLGVKGESLGNGYLPQSMNEYEICFKCHADSANKPQSFDTSAAGIGYGRNPKRQGDVSNPNAFNARVEFTTGASYHPVTRPRNASVPSLRPYVLDGAGTSITTRPLSAGSLIYCTDCHNNDSGRNLGAAGSGPTGPHGSNIPHLLERQNMLEPVPGVAGLATAGVPYSIANYGLCDKCHDVQGSILRDLSFKNHSQHVVNDGAACATCHAAHAAPSPALINFDLSIVGPNSQGQVSFINTGPGHGTCNLMCHGTDHVNVSY